jgi:hypothetical protein
MAPPMPPKRAATSKQRRAAQQQQQRRVAQPAAVPLPPIPVAQHPQSAPLSTAAPAFASPSARPATTQVDASAIARWAKPATLRQQFILTEVFQPPIALREQA